jgi:hypothetical protein
MSNTVEMPRGAHTKQDELLRQWLPDRCFPATAERLMVHLIRNGSPSSLIWLISSRCSQHQTIGSFAELERVLSQPSPPQGPGTLIAG